MAQGKTAENVILGYYEQVWAQRQPERIPDFFAPEYTNHAGSRGVLSGPAGIRSNFDATTAAFPDVSFTVDDVIAQGEKVALRYTMKGTHQGPFQEIAATGRAVTVSGIGIYRVEGGLIRESWVVRDSLSLLRQIGAAP